MELKIKKETAKRLYPESQSWFQEQLEGAFGKECFKKKDWRDIKTFEDACEALGLNHSDFIIEHCLPDEIAYKKLKVVVMAINHGWILDWNNPDQCKWAPWFNLSSGFSFSYSSYSYGCSNTTVGSRLCFESKEKSEYTATQFIDLYKEFLALTK